MTPLFREDKPLDPELAAAPGGGTGHAIVVGHGRVGQVVCSEKREEFRHELRRAAGHARLVATATRATSDHSS
jgi:hypothetical protein